jgi:hypothetical protein
MISISLEAGRRPDIYISSSRRFASPSHTTARGIVTTLIQKYARSPMFREAVSSVLLDSGIEGLLTLSRCLLGASRHPHECRSPDVSAKVRLSIQAINARHQRRLLGDSLIQ